MAADLLSQAEHGSDSQLVCVIEEIGLVEKIKEAMELQIQTLPRKAIALMALENSMFVFISDMQDRIDFINAYAPEHYLVCVEDSSAYLSQLENAGSVFIGNYTPESAGDYASGTNHTLPTSGYAKVYSGVNMDSFVKKITFQEIKPIGLKNLGPAIQTMAMAEGLRAHAEAIAIRLKYLEDGI